LAALIRSSPVFPPPREPITVLLTLFPHSGKRAVSNDPFLSKGSYRDSRETAKNTSSRWSRLHSCDCNSYRYRIVKELVLELHPRGAVVVRGDKSPLATSSRTSFALRSSRHPADQESRHAFGMPRLAPSPDSFSLPCCSTVHLSIS